LVQERTRVAQAESKQLVEQQLLLSKEQALALAHRLFAELRSVVMDEAIFAGGPQAVLAALQRRLSAVMGRPAEAAEVIDGAVVEFQGDGGCGG
jgi:hypothetical protein